MTKIYEGNGEYTIHLSTGKELKLTEAELDEMANGTELVEELKGEIKELEIDLSNISGKISHKDSVLSEIEKIIVDELR